MSDPPFKIGDRVVCVNGHDSGLAQNGVYQIYDIDESGGVYFVGVTPDGTRGMYLASRFILEQPATPDDYPDSVEDYAHNKPHYIIAWGAASLLIWLAFFAGLWMGWAWL